MNIIKKEWNIYIDNLVITDTYIHWFINLSREKKYQLISDFISFPWEYHFLNWNYYIKAFWDNKMNYIIYKLPNLAFWYFQEKIDINLSDLDFIVIEDYNLKSYLKDIYDWEIKLI